MAAATEPRIILDSGNLRVGTTMSSRTFFVYVSPTGAELPIGQCPIIKKEYTRSTGAFGSTDFSQTASYILRGEGRLKMICLSSSFGKPRKVVNFMIDIGPDLEVMEIVGAGNCGRFHGRGRVDLKASILRENQSAIEVTNDILKDHFGHKILQRGASSPKNKGTRSLIF